MANELNSIAGYLANNITILRKKRGLSQSALAGIAKLPRSTITHMESGNGNPSLQNLARIAGALQVSIEELLAAPRTNCKLIRRDEVRAMRRSQGEATVFKLLPDPIPGMELDRMEIRPRSRIIGVPHVAGTKEYLTVISGAVNVHVAGEKFRVEPGDVLAFPGDQAHSYINADDKLAILISVVVLAPAGI